MLVPERDATMAALRAAGIGCAIYYPVPLHLQEVHASLPYDLNSFPHAEVAANHCLSLPMFPELSLEQAETVINVLKQAIISKQVAA